MHDTKTLERRRERQSCGALVTLALLALASACPKLGDPVADKTEVSGSPFGADFTGSSAAHKIVPEGAIKSTVVRIAPRSDVCEALADPTDDLDPSLLIVIKGTQTSKDPYQVVDLNYVPPAGATPPPVATVTLERHNTTCDGGSEDAGFCGTFVSATSGEVTLQQLVENELATGLFKADFAGGGTVEGMFSAPACPTIR